MLKSRLSRIMLCAFIACLMIPVLINGTRQGGNTLHNNPFIKLPPVITVGPESSPYVLTQGERGKLSLVIEEQSFPEQTMLADQATITTTGEYSGLTDGEFKKLQQAHRTKTMHRSTGEKEEPISTIEMVPRTSGVEGLTQAEKTKLEAWKKSRASTPRTGHGE